MTWFDNLQKDVQQYKDNRAKRLAKTIAGATCNCGAIATISSPDYEQRMVTTHEVWCKSNDVHR